MNYAWLYNLYSFRPRGPGSVYETFVVKFLCRLFSQIFCFLPLHGRRIEFFKESARVQYFA